MVGRERRSCWRGHRSRSPLDSRPPAEKQKALSRCGCPERARPVAAIDPVARTRSPDRRPRTEIVYVHGHDDESEDDDGARLAVQKTEGGCPHDQSHTRRGIQRVAIPLVREQDATASQVMGRMEHNNDGADGHHLPMHRRGRRPERASVRAGAASKVDNETHDRGGKQRRKRQVAVGCARKRTDRTERSRREQ